MSFLLRRTRRAFAGWSDLDSIHARPNESPVRPPWTRMNTNRTSDLVNNQLTIGPYSETVFEGGGVSYAYQPFTRNWGYEVDVLLNANPVQLQFWGAGIARNWTSVQWGSIMADGVPIVCVYRDAFNGSNTIRVIAYEGGSVVTLGQSANRGDLFGGWHNFRVWWDDDQTVRVFWDGGLALWVTLPAKYKRGPGLRSPNFLNQTDTTSYMRNFKIYDRITDIPSWIDLFWDGFDRPNGQVGNNWWVYGNTNGQIVNNSYAYNSLSDAGSAILRDGGVSNGIQRVVGVVGGNNPPGDRVDSSLYLRVSGDGTSGLAANIFSGKIYIARFSGGAHTPTFTDYAMQNFTVPNGAVVEFCVNGSLTFVRVNGAVACVAYVDQAVPWSNRLVGLRVRRQSFQNSNSWDQFSCAQGV